VRRLKGGRAQNRLVSGALATLLVGRPCALL